MKSTRRVSFFVCAITMAVATSIVAAQVPFEVVHDFSRQTSPGHNGIIQAADGNFYGTTYQGGAFGLGTAFKMTPAGIVTVLHDFAGSPDGARPLSAVIQATDGNFYGTTSEGGSGCGTVFKMTAAGTVTVLHSFIVPNGHFFESVEGCSPEAPLIQASDGTFYGSALDGGPYGDAYSAGTLFKIAGDGTFAVLHAFSLGSGYPSGALVQTTDGTFYGAVSEWGNDWAGAIFKMAPDGTFTPVRGFGGGEGRGPSSLVQGSDGNLYGTTSDGGYPGGYGAVFKMTPSGVLSVLHLFTGTNGEGAYPGVLLRAVDGNFYGTTTSGGDGWDPYHFGPGYSGHGTVFKVTPDGTVSTLYTFANGIDGAYPSGALVQGLDGSLYGTTQDDDHHGSVFRVTTAGALTTIVSSSLGFEGYTPEAPLIEGADGNLYGTTAAGGPHYMGTVFRTTPGGVTTVFHGFTGADGAAPSAALVQAPDGNFLGTTTAGGASNLGTVFRMGPDGSVTVLYAFTGGADGAAPYAALVRGPDGNFYGTTRDGGPLNFGTVFRVAPSGTYAVVYRFAGGYDGGHPLAGLVLGTDGNFYGTTSITGAFNAGTTFRLTSQGRLTILHAFSGSDGTHRDGSYPQAALLQARDGNFYGTTSAGGTFGRGTMFRMTADGMVTILHSFAEAEGANPVAALIQGSDGNFYGIASERGNTSYAAGTAFRSTPTGTVTVIQSFGDNPFDCPYGGFYPHAALLQAHDGYMYGTASQGGCGGGGGTVFRLRVAPDIPTHVGATSTADRRVRLRWPVVANAASYTVRRGLASGHESVLATGLIAPMFSDDSTTKGQRYYYVVSAINAFGETASYEISITPGRAIDGDFDGDGTSDITVFRPGTGTWFTVQSGSGTGTVTAWGNSGDIPVPGDYDGDGKTDVAVYRPSTGAWYIVSSSTGNGFAHTWGASGDTPVAGDYDGDGKTDIAVYRPSTGIWYVVPSSTGSGFAYTWGTNGDIPVAADYDGDGKTDIAVYRPSTGVWYIVASTTGNGIAYPWGIGGDIPMAGGDYDGDGKADVAVFRPSTGVWYIVPSSTGNGFAYAWGVSADAPVVGDYDGDGKTDIAVYRPSTGTWFIVPSSTGNGFAYAWGASGDLPILKRP